MFNGFGFDSDFNNDGSFQPANGNSNQSHRRSQPPNRQYNQFRRPYEQPNNFNPYTRTQEQTHSRQQSRNSSSQSNPSLNSSNNNNLEVVSKPRICHYEILGIEKTASQKDIKRAYHKQSLVWHPDKNSDRLELAEEKFKLVSEAYQILSDDEKKQLYDTYGFEGPSSESNQSFNQEDFSSELFTFSRSQPFSHPFFSAPGPPSLFDFFGSDPFSVGPNSSLFGSQHPPFGNRGHRNGLGNFFSFGREPFPDPFESLRSFASPFSMFPGMSDMRTNLSSFGEFPPSASMSGNSSFSSTSYVNGRSTTYIRKVDSNGNVTTEVRYD